MKLKPLNDLVVIKRAEALRTTESGLVLPEDSQQRPDSGKVVAVGIGRHTEHGVLIPMTVQVGDTVLFGKYAGQTIRVEGEEFLVVPEKDLIAVEAV